MFNCNKIHKTFKTNFNNESIEVLNDISFSISENEVIGFLGNNGAGKTTFIKIMMMLMNPTSGSIEYDSKLGKDPEEIYSHIGHLPEKVNLYSHLTGNDFLKYLIGIHQLDEKKTLSTGHQLAERLGIHNDLEKKIKTFSKGMTQKLGLISVLLHEPKLLILDEPFSGIDPIGRKEIKDLIHDINAKGVTIFFTTHILADVEDLCERVLFLKNSQMVYDGSLENLRNRNSQNEYSEYEVKTMDSSGKIIKTICSKEEKEDLLLQKIQNQEKIISVNSKLVSLEEIFYEIGKEAH